MRVWEERSDRGYDYTRGHEQKSGMNMNIKTPHGNLIDVDALKRAICEMSPRERLMDTTKCVEMIVRLINSVPIVVPAENGEEGTKEYWRQLCAYCTKNYPLYLKKQCGIKPRCFLLYSMRQRPYTYPYSFSA